MIENKAKELTEEAWKTVDSLNFDLAKWHEDRLLTIIDKIDSAKRMSNKRSLTLWMHKLDEWIKNIKSIEKFEREGLQFKVLNIESLSHVTRC
jgi:hypothetical protein